MEGTAATKMYRLRMSLGWRAVFAGAALLSFGMVAEALATGEAFVIGTSLAFFGLGGLVVLKLMLRNSGRIELQDEGLLLDCYLATGFIPWDHLEPPRDLTVLGARYLGLNTRDPQGYLESRQHLSGLAHDGDRRLGQGMLRVMLALLSVLPGSRSSLSALLALFGMAPLPKKTDEASLLEWNRESYGSQIFIHKMWLPEFDRLLSDLQSAVASRGAVDVRMPEAVPQTPGAAASKTCPMCAEHVQQDAKICRYCRYLFDEKRFLPEAS